MHVENVFFDLDHTLWDFEKNSALAFQKIFKERDFNFSFDEFLKLYTPINENYWKLYRDEKVTKEELRYGRLKDTFDAMKVSVDDFIINQISTDYIDYLPLFNHLFEGTIELLDYLNNKYKLHVITNGFEEVQQLKLKSSGILKYFDEVISSEKVGVKKPNPRVFEYALKSAKANPKSSIMIGDNLEADIQGAINCGLYAIHFNSANLTEIPKNIESVHHLLEIKQYL